MRWPFPAVSDTVLTFLWICLETVRVATNSSLQLVQSINAQLIMYMTYPRILGILLTIEIQNRQQLINPSMRIHFALKY